MYYWFLFQIDTQKLTFKETAKPRTDTGVAPGKSRPDSGIECEKTEASVWRQTILFLISLFYFN